MERIYFIKYAPETVRFQISEYGWKYVSFYCWKPTDINFCTIICLEVKGFNNKGFYIFVDLKTQLLEPFTNRRNHVIYSFKITFTVSIFSCKWMASLCCALIVIDAMQYWILWCFSFSRQPRLFNEINRPGITSDNLE